MTSQTWSHRRLAKEIEVELHDCCYPLSVYLAKIEDAAETLHMMSRDLGHQYQADITKAIKCGRLLSENPVTNNLRPSWYCRRAKFCAVCHHHYATNFAKDFVADLLRNGGIQNVYDLLLTMPLPLDRREEVRQTLLAQQAAANLLDYLKNWNRNPELKKFQDMLRIFIGLHLKPNNAGVIQPHLHAILVTEHRLLMREFARKINIWWELITFNNLPKSGRMSVEKLGVLASASSPNAKRHRAARR